MNLSDKKVLVVGASGVLGGEITRLLLQRGASVYATARSLESAERIAPKVTQRIVLDLVDENSISWATDWVKQNVELDGIVVASGQVGFGRAVDTDPQQLSLLNRVNFEGPAAVISSLLGNLSSRPDAFIAAITGVVAEKSYPGMTAYSSGKAALSAWLSGLRLELKSAGVNVLEARPGHTETGLAARPAFGAAPAFSAGMTPIHVAEVIVAGIESGATLLASTDF